MYRDGQWVAFAADIPGAAHTRSGKVVGLHHKARRARLGNSIVPVPAQIVPVDKNGLGIPGPGYANLSFALGDVRHLEPITDKADIPAARLRGVPESWQPRP